MIRFELCSNFGPWASFARIRLVSSPARSGWVCAAQINLRRVTMREGASRTGRARYSPASTRTNGACRRRFASSPSPKWQESNLIRPFVLLATLDNEGKIVEHLTDRHSLRDGENAGHR